MVFTFPGVPPYNITNQWDWMVHARNTINGCLNGKTNNTGTVTLQTSTVTTTVQLATGRLGNDTVILFEPTNAAAAIESGAGTMWVSTRDVAASLFKITNSLSLSARTFNYILVG